MSFTLVVCLLCFDVKFVAAFSYLHLTLTLWMWGLSLNLVPFRVSLMLFSWSLRSYKLVWHLRILYCMTWIVIGEGVIKLNGYKSFWPIISDIINRHTHWLSSLFSTIACDVKNSVNETDCLLLHVTYLSSSNYVYFSIVKKWMTKDGDFLYPNLKSGIVRISG